MAKIIKEEPKKALKRMGTGKVKTMVTKAEDKSTQKPV